MVILSGVLRRCSGAAQKGLGTKLLETASELGEKTATFELVENATIHGRSDRYKDAFLRLRHMAQNEIDLESMALLGKVCFKLQNHDEALKWIQKATRPPTGNIEFPGAGDALVCEGSIHYERGEMEEAEAVFKKAALELDEPMAYFRLSLFQEPGSPEFEVYLLKAAASGVNEAKHALGSLALQRLKQQEKSPTTLADYGMAREWFQVAADSGYAPAMLDMARICKAVGEGDAALNWVLKTEDKAVDAESRRQVRIMKKNLRWRMAS